MWGQGSLTCKQIITTFVLHKEGKWNEIPYIQIFITLYQDRNLRKTCRMCVATMSDELEYTFLTALARCRPPNRPLPKSSCLCLILLLQNCRHLFKVLPLPGAELIITQTLACYIWGKSQMENLVKELFVFMLHFVCLTLPFAKINLVIFLKTLVNLLTT